MKSSYRGDRTDRFVVFAQKIQNFMSVLGKLELADSNELDVIYKSKPRDIFYRFMMKRVERVTNERDGHSSNLQAGRST